MVVPVLEEFELFRVVNVDRPHQPWLATVAEEPEAADEIAAIPFDDEGHACGPAIKGSTLLPRSADVA